MTPRFRLLELAVYSLSFILISLALVGGIIGYSPVPYWDMWDGTVNFILRFDDAPLDRMFEQHNEHRLVLARGFFLIEYYVFDGSGIFLTVGNYLFVFVSWGIFARCLYQINAPDSPPRDTHLLVAILGAWLFLWAQKVNFLWAFQSQFFLAQLLPLIAFLLLSKAAHQSRIWSLTFYAAILVGMASALSMANGVMALPLMAVWAIILRMTKIQIFVLALTAALTLWLYFMDYSQPSGHGALTETIMTDPVGILIYTFRYLGNPGVHLAGSSDFIKAISTFGGVGLAVFAAGAAFQAVQKRPTEPAQAGLLLFIIYVGASAFVTAGGRLLLGMDTAVSSRYTTPTLMAWAAVFCIASPQILRIYRFSDRAALSLVSGAVVALCLLMVSQVRALGSKHELNHDKALAVLALEMGIGDSKPISLIYPNIPHILDVARHASDADLGIFGRPRYRGVRESIGQPAETPTTKTCSGRLERYEIIDNVADYVRIYGWQYDSTRKPNVARIQLVDKQGIIVGAALFGRDSPEIKNAYGPAAAQTGFVGYLKTDALGQTLITQSDACHSKAQL